MIYSIGETVDFNNGTLGWSSDWDSTDIFGEDYPHHYVVGLYNDMQDERISYYIDLRDSKVMTIFIEDENEEDIDTIWNEEYFV